MLKYHALPTNEVRVLQAGGPDAYGNIPERAISDGVGAPCRHCLRNIPKGRDMLILAHRPFVGAHPYAETGPIFLCADACDAGGGAEPPEILTTSPDYLIKGYDAREWIVYGTGAVVRREELEARAAAILEHPAVVSVHVRSARNNCYQLRIDRADSA